MLARGLLDQGPVSGAVIGVPGRIDYAAGELEFAPNLPPGWVEELSQRYLTESLGVRISLANDADLAAVGEARFGAGRGHQDVVYMTVSTGIGAGVLLGGRLLRGRLSLAEVGHTVIDRDALPRAAPATLEELGSGTALGRAAQAASLAADARQLAQLVRRGDARAVAIWKRGAEAVAIGVLNLVQTFSPEVVVIGGGVGRSALLLDPVRALLAASGPRGLKSPVAVVGAALGDDAGLAGAAGWASAFHGPRSECSSTGDP